jgi:ubiquitin-protein ligase
MNPHLRRLAADFEALRSEFSGHPHVHVQALGPLPPEGYRVTYRLAGLRLEGEQPVSASEHVVEIRLPLGYPREQPYCVPLTPLFHPNVDGHYCIADYWSAGEGLVDVVAKIGDMIQYRIFNTRSPLNAVAAYWAEQHPEVFPVGRVQLVQPELEISLSSPRNGRPPVVALADVAASVDEPTVLITIRGREEMGA